MIRQQFEEALTRRYIPVGLPLDATIAMVIEELSHPAQLQASSLDCNGPCPLMPSLNRNP
jgi:hypothetical protein